MNKKQYINKLSVYIVLVIFSFFSCKNDKEIENELEIGPFQLEIDSANASNFANSFVQDIYNSDTLNARRKIHIDYGEETECAVNLLSEKALLNEVDLFIKLRKLIDQGADLKFIGINKRDAQYSVLIRLFIPPLEVTYYEVNLNVLNNQIVVTDYTTYSQGLSHLDAMEELVQLFCQNKERQTEIIAGVNYLDSTKMAFQNRSPDKAENYYNLIMPELIKTKFVKAVKYDLEIHSSEDIRLAALNKTIQNSSDLHFSVWLNRFYLYAAQREFAKARLALDNFSLKVQDPILIYLEAATFYEEQDYSHALELYNKALSEDTSIPNFHFAKVICLIEMKEYVQAVESLLVMEDFFEVENINWDKEFIAYPEFLISEEYSQWLERIGVDSETELF